MAWHGRHSEARSKNVLFGVHPFLKAFNYGSLNFRLGWIGVPPSSASSPLFTGHDGTVTLFYHFNFYAVPRADFRNQKNLEAEQP